MNRDRGDGGQVTTALAVVVSLGLLFVTMSVVLPLGQAADQRTGAQSAADAAALAAAEQLRDDLPQTIASAATAALTVADLPHLLDGLTCGLGAAEAQQFAAANQADVTSYCYTRFSDQFEVEVRSRQVAQNGGRATARATAQLGPRLGPCAIDVPPVPVPGPVTGAVLDCGDLTLTFTVNVTGKPTLVTTPAEIVAQLKPRLVA